MVIGNRLDFESRDTRSSRVGGAEADMDKIYIVTTLHSKKTKRKRLWGWFDNYEDARTCIMDSHNGIYECGFYDLAVIEEVSNGLVFRSNMQHWFKVEYDVEEGTHVVYESTKPLKFAKEHLVAF